MSGVSKKRNALVLFGPGLLVAATGVGAGDLATSSLVGSQLGMAVLWAVILGAFLKYVLNEGLTRWQLSTGRTLLEGCITHLGLPFRVIFLVYLLAWSFFLGSALMGACGVTMHAMVPVFDDARTGKIVFGIAHSILGVVLVRLGGYRLFEQVMRICIALMFFTVIVAAVFLRPAPAELIRGIFIPMFPVSDPSARSWTVALMGGVGGTLTIVCYGYWIREEGREGLPYLRDCRIDLAAGYLMTALFGMAMVIIGTTIVVEGEGAGLIVKLAERLEDRFGPIGKWMFLLGAWGAVFSSLLGVWQSVPYIFADFWRLTRDATVPVRTDSRPYQGYLYALALVPILALPGGFSTIQKYYAVLGAFFMPLLAIVLLYLNGRASLVGAGNTNRPLTTALLLGTVFFFAYVGYLEVIEEFQ